MLRIYDLVIDDCDDADLPCLFENRKRIRHCPRCCSAEIPSQRHGTEFEWTGWLELRQHYGGLARAEYHGFCIPLIIGLRHRNDRQIAKARIVNQHVREFDGRAFLKDCLTRNAGTFRGCIKSGEQILRTSPALCGLPSNDPGNIGEGTYSIKEMSRNLHVRLA